jgi:ATP-dependent protease ClpP protease subunit
VFFKKMFLTVVSFVFSGAALATEFSNNTNKMVLLEKQSSPNVTCQSLECQERLKKLQGTVVLDSHSTITLRGTVTNKTVSETISKILTSKEDTVTLFLSSPGGSVIDGAQLISTIRSVNKKVVCVTDMSASMSFVILQACDERVVLESSILMQHVASFGVSYQQEPNAVSFVKFIQNITSAMDAAQAKRMEMPVSKFKQLIRDDYWLFGSQAVQAKAADRVAQVVCSPELVSKEEVEEVSVWGATIVVKWSACPLISSPRSVSVKRYTSLSPLQEEELSKKLKSVIDYKADIYRMFESRQQKSTK